MINSFNKLLNELFYDWDSYSDPNLKVSVTSGYYYTNKTTIYQKDNQYFLNYKTDTIQINKKTYKKFIEFYEHLYYNDIEFQKVVNLISEIWFEKEKIEIHRINSTIMLNSLLIQNDTKEIISDNQKFNVSDSTMIKVEMFIKMIED